MNRPLKYTAALQEAFELAMQRDPNIIIIGEGVPDPKAIFMTTAGLREKFGERRILDMPLSENGMTGVCIGAAIAGLHPVLTHQRIDFALLSIDQIINNAAKMHYMFAGQHCVPLVIRMIIGRGWGQGAQHSQSLQALFAHIPGLKVVMPTNATDAKGMMLASLEDHNTVIFLEHRWLHNIVDDVPEGYYITPIGKCKIIREGTNVTIVATSYMNVDALKAAAYLQQRGISAEIIDVRTIKPLDMDTIIKSVKKTKHLVVLDTGHLFCGVAGEIIASVTEKAFHHLKSAPVRITLPDYPTPTSQKLSNQYYPGYQDIVRSILLMHNQDPTQAVFPQESLPLDIPDPSFKGPF